MYVIKIAFILLHVCDKNSFVNFLWIFYSYNIYIPWNNMPFNMLYNTKLLITQFRTGKAQKRGSSQLLIVYKT